MYFSKELIIQFQALFFLGTMWTSRGFTHSSLRSSCRTLSGRGQTHRTLSAFSFPPGTDIHSSSKLYRPITGGAFRSRFSPVQTTKELGLRMASSSSEDEKTFGTPGKEMARASHILVKTEEEVNEIFDGLKGGDQNTFSELAKEKSSCPSAGKGGDLGWFGRGMMVAEFDEACFENGVGDLVKVESQFGWHAVLITGRGQDPGAMSVKELNDLLQSDATTREQYQFIDVREPNEIEIASIQEPTDTFLNLPLSEFQSWASKVDAGELLDRTKPTVVLCHHGGRSMQAAQFFTSRASFEGPVYNVVGGIHAYSTDVDPSVPTY